MLNGELTMDERQNDLWVQDGKYYAIVVMYKVNETSEPRFVAVGPLKGQTVEGKVEAMLNAVEQGRFMCASSHFLNPKNVVCIKVGLWKDKNERNMVDGGFYD